jgi:isopentenyl phosphate kinase
MIFLKLGGSLITDKTVDNTPRIDTLARLAREIYSSLDTPFSTLLLGHGSGSFGHAAARKHGTRAGASTQANWRGFAEVSVMAARLNRIVADALHEAGVPVFNISPSASARCQDGTLVYLETAPIQQALARGLVPLVMGDVAFDSERGATIVSTEEVFAYLANHLPVRQVLLAGETDGVYERWADERSSHSLAHLPSRPVIPRITPLNWDDIRGGIGGSRGADVTGGMASKVREMLALVQTHPALTVRIFSGLEPGNVQRALAGEALGTEICVTDDARLVGPDLPTNA